MEVSGSCTNYVAISESELNDDVVEVPVEEDGGILLTSVQSQFPSAVGLKFRSPNNNRGFRGVRLADGVLYPPEGRWGDIVYIVNTAAKIQTTDNKRKMEDSAQAEVSKTKRPTPQSSDLVVLNLPYHYTKENLIEFFSDHGEISFAQIMKNATGQSRGFGFVRFVNYDDQKRITGSSFMIDGRKVEVKKPNSQSPELFKVFVGRLSSKITKDDLLEYFEKFGAVSDVYYDEGRKQYAFVTFEESIVAERAIAEKTHYVKGVHIVVKPADPVDKNKQQHHHPQTAMPGAKVKPFGNTQNSPMYSSLDNKYAPSSPYDGYTNSYTQQSVLPTSVLDAGSTHSSLHGNNSHQHHPHHHSSNSSQSYHQSSSTASFNYQPMSPPVVAVTNQHPMQQPPPSVQVDPGTFGQEMFNVMAKMMATAMTGTFNTTSSNQSNAAGMTNHLSMVGASNRLNTSFDNKVVSPHQIKTEQASIDAQQSSSSMMRYHPHPHAHSQSHHSHPPLPPMTNPYRSPPHDPYADNMYY